MAAFNGAISNGDLKLIVSDAGVDQYDSSNICHMYFIYRLPISLPAWADVTPQEVGMFRDDLPLRVSIKQEAYHTEPGGAGTIYTKFYTARENNSSFTRNITATIATPTWQAADEDADYPIECQEFTNIPGDNPPLFMVAEAQFYYDGDAANHAEINAVDIETVIDSPETTDRVAWFNHGAGRLYDADMPVDAWLIAHCLCQTYHALLRDNKPIFSTPLSGWPTP
jgi:hypothetical protein